MNFVKPSQTRIPYSPWKGWKNSEFAKKIRAALGMRVNEEGNNETYRKSYNVAGSEVDPDKNLCHKFRQDQDGADAVHFSATTGKVTVLDVPLTAGDSQVIFEIRKGGTAILQITGDGQIRTAATDFGGLTGPIV